eukprot:341000_1
MNQNRLCFIVLSILITFDSTYGKFSESKDELCVRSSRSYINGAYQWSFWNSNVNGSGYHNHETNISIYPFIKTGGRYRYYIGRNISSTSMLAYCKINLNHSEFSDGNIFNVDDCVRNWYIGTGGNDDARLSFLRDPNMVVTSCQDVCVSGNNYSAVDGTYVFSHFDFSKNGSIYYCSLCAAFLYPIIKDGDFYWKVGSDYTSPNAWSSCNLGNISNGYLGDCMGKWKSYHSSKETWLPSLVLTEKCNYPEFNTTTTMPPEGDTEQEFFDVFVISVCCVLVLLVLGGWVHKKFKKQQKEKVQWDAVFDFNDTRSNFKSTQSLQAYLSQQSWSKEMVVSLAALFIASAINTYTNVNSFLHYRDYIIAESTWFWDFGVKYMSAIEFIFSIMSIISTILFYIIFEYKDAVLFMVGVVPKVSALWYFVFLNTNVAKRVICKGWDSTKTLVGKLCITAALSFGLVMCSLMGIFVFTNKIWQIAYIYNKDFMTLDRWDFLAVVGVARQFAALLTFGKTPYFGWAFSTIHPEKLKSLKEIDDKWKDKNDIDSIICTEMVEQYGFWGYCWLCYTFNNKNNVKKLYLLYIADQGAISMADPTAYVQMIDRE